MLKKNAVSIRTVGIIGAGAMGRGIAEVCGRTGLHVRLLDVQAEVASSVIQKIRARHANAEIHLATSETDFGDADLVIETVPENFELKAGVLSQIEPYLSGHAIIASNTSSLSIGQLARTLQSAERFCGLHFCHPVTERPLVEVVKADATSASTTSRAHKFALDIGMSPVTVRDSPGFLLNRLLVPYMNETLELLLHGASIESLDRAAKAFGMPIRPLALFDEFGIDVALAVGRSLYLAFPERIAPSELLIAMYKSGRRGRKSGGGFFKTSKDAISGRVDPDAAKLIESRRQSGAVHPDDLVAKRLFLPMLMEATRVLEESLVEDPQVIDDALRDGLGMQAPYTGLFAWANAIGAGTLLKWLRPLQCLGKRFEPTRLVLDAARHNRPVARRPGMIA